jgi:hypothetical protein
MKPNSLNFKGLPNGKSLEAQCFPSQNVNSLTLQRERDSNARSLSGEKDLHKYF